MAATQATKPAPPRGRGGKRERAAPARAALLNVARDMIRERGFSATSIDDLCRAAGVTKGAFFHHFASKEALGIAVAEWWSVTTAPLFAGAPHHALPDPADRVLAYLAMRRWMVGADVAKFSCLAGMLASEVYRLHPAVRAAAWDAIRDNAATLEGDMAAALAASDASGGVTAQSLALHVQTVLQGSFVMAKASEDPALAIDAMDHLIRYCAQLFDRPLPATPDRAEAEARGAVIRAYLENLMAAEPPRTSP